ncbi:hypothetical protein K502DRAFT_342093 [Neoconidiobolus thromboides FSU 785]|nr:hypothetical protein K502DRAFT_342093 [Neoconidiobolus thromboides FSU 785]
MDSTISSLQDITSILEENQYKSSIFYSTTNLRFGLTSEQQEILKSQFHAGHEIGIKLELNNNEKAVDKEILTNQKKIHSIIQRYPKFIMYLEAIKEVIKPTLSILNLISITPNLSIEDIQSDQLLTLFDKYDSSETSFILDLSNNNISLLKFNQLIENIKKNGFTVIPLSQCLGESSSYNFNLLDIDINNKDDTEKEEKNISSKEVMNIKEDSDERQMYEIEEKIIPSKIVRLKFFGNKYSTLSEAEVKVNKNLKKPKKKYRKE